MGKKVKIGVVGCGYWGPNLIRNFNALSTCELAAICDTDSKRLVHLSTVYPGVQPYKNFDNGSKYADIPEIRARRQGKLTESGQKEGPIHLHRSRNSGCQRVWTGILSARRSQAGAKRICPMRGGSGDMGTYSKAPNMSRTMLVSVSFLARCLRRTRTPSERICQMMSATRSMMW